LILRTASVNRGRSLARRYGAGTTVLERRDRLICSRCNGWDVDFVVSASIAEPTLP
jgi:hypothetical protein